MRRVSVMLKIRGPCPVNAASREEVRLDSWVALETFFVECSCKAIRNTDTFIQRRQASCRFLLPVQRDLSNVFMANRRRNQPKLFLSPGSCLSAACSLPLLGFSSCPFSCPFFGVKHLFSHLECVWSVFAC